MSSWKFKNTCIFWNCWSSLLDLFLCSCNLMCCDMFAIIANQSNNTVFGKNFNAVFIIYCLIDTSCQYFHLSWYKLVLLRRRI